MNNRTHSWNLSSNCWSLKRQEITMKESRLLLYRNPVHTSQETCYVSATESSRLKLFTAVAIKNAVFWDVTLCDFCKNIRFGGTYRLHHQGDKNRQARNNVRKNYQPNHAAMFPSQYLRLKFSTNFLFL
jgi:hypothetical protein